MAVVRGAGRGRGGAGGHLLGEGGQGETARGWWSWGAESGGVVVVVVAVAEQLLEVCPQQLAHLARRLAAELLLAQPTQGLAVQLRDIQ